MRSASMGRGERPRQGGGRASKRQSSSHRKQRGVQATRVALAGVGKGGVGGGGCVCEHAEGLEAVEGSHGCNPPRFGQQ
jgi:hypothetical protein